MKYLKKWLIALDLSPHDEQMMNYAEGFSQAVMPDEITLVHIMNNPDDLRKLFQSEEDYEEYLREREKSILDTLTDYKNRFFGHRRDVLINTLVLYGEPLPELLRFTEELDPDLLLLGKKVKSSGSGIIAQKVARRTKCSILFITENARYPAKKVLVPTDYSENSRRALQLAIHLHPLLNDPEIHCLYVFDVPLLLPYKIEMLPEEMDELYRKNAEEGMEKYLRDNGADKLNIVKVLIRNTRNNPAKQIIDYAKEKNINLIILGAKGHSKLASLMLGSTTEKILQYDHNIPVLIVR